MPELPEVEIVKRSLFKMINKAKILDIKIKNKKLRYRIPSSFSQYLINEKILNISRKSKYLIFYFKSKLLLIHLGMTGKIFLLRDNDKVVFKTSFYYDLNINPKHNHIFIKLNNGFIMVYNDVRRFGFFKLFDNRKFEKIKFLSKLGLEPLNKNFDLKYFKNFIKNKKKNIKNLLMDQTFVAGLGNIYVNEALFMAKIHPLKLSMNLSKYEISNLIFKIKKILKFSISKGGASIKDFRNIAGKSGNYQQFFYVYGKENKKCSRVPCKGTIKKIQIANRSSFYCNKCQK